MNHPRPTPTFTHVSPVNVSDSAKNVARVFQILVLVSTVVVIIGLFIRPVVTELVLWSVIIPLLPASFLISPSLWRAVCPLATLNMAGNGLISRKRIARTGMFRAEIIGIVLLLVLVPARRFILNENGPVLGVLIAVIAVTTIVLGLFYASKAGFCNSICPVLPVEKLYGQRPLLNVKNTRCLPCDACTQKGCYDLGADKSISFSLRGNGFVRPTWKSTAFAIFASGFPGFIIGYFAVENSVLAAAPAVYGQILGYMLISIILFHGAFSLMNIRIDIAILILGTLSVGLYYWYSGPAISTAFNLDPVVGTGIRVATLALVAYWTFRGIRGITTGVAMPVSARSASLH